MNWAAAERTLMQNAAAASCILSHLRTVCPLLFPSEKARELELFATRQMGCNYYAIEYQGHGDSSPNFLECTLGTW